MTALATDRSHAGVGVRDVVFTFTFETWADAVRREMHRPPDRLLQTLLEHPAVGGLLVVNPFRSRPVQIARGVTATAHHEDFPHGTCRGLLTPVRVRRHDPGRAASLERHYRSYDRQVRRAAADLGLDSPVVITSDPIVAGFAPLGWAGPVTYYARDDWTVHPGYRRWWAACALAYTRMRERGVRVCAVSEQLLQRLAPTGLSAVVPNGVVAGEWSAVHAPPAPTWVDPRKPLVVYVGTIDSRIDVGIVGACAASFPHVAFTFVGQIDDPAHLAPLSVYPNVSLRSSVSRPEMVGLVRAASCCIVPHRPTRLTEAMSPLKLYEYVAAGRPVVATNLPPMRDVHPAVKLAAGKREFVEALRAALEEPPMGEAQRQAFIRDNDWRSRHETLLAVAYA